MADTKIVDPPAESADERRAAIGWGRASLSALVTVAIGFIGVVWLPDLIVRQLTSVGRDTRVLIAATVSVIAVVLVAWGLRRFQARGLI
jgi:hypothetical protein